MHSKAEFIVDSKDLGIKDDGTKVSCTITNPSGNKTENFISPESDGTYNISYTPFEEGQFTLPEVVGWKVNEFEYLPYLLSTVFAYRGTYY